MLACRWDDCLIRIHSPDNGYEQRPTLIASVSALHNFINSWAALQSVARFMAPDCGGEIRENDAALQKALVRSIIIGFDDYRDPNDGSKVSLPLPK